MIVVSLEGADLGAIALTPQILQLQFVKPVPAYWDGRVARPTSGFRTPSRPGHDGIDLLFDLLPSDGHVQPPYTDGEGLYWFPWDWPIVAVADGVVGRSTVTATGGYLRIDHAGGISSQYMHLAKRTVAVGQRVRKGQVIGIAGAGNSHLVHLHFQMMADHVVVDPTRYYELMPAIANPLRKHDGSWRWAVAGLAIAAGALAYHIRSRRMPN